MKKILQKHILIFFGVILGSQGYASEQYSVESYTIPAEIKKAVGYDPHIRLIRESNQGVYAKQKHVTVFLHDYNASAKGAFKLKKAHLLPGDVITFNLPDAAKRILGMPIAKFYRTSFGQMNEILVALTALKYGALDTYHAQAIDLYGLSRGGALLINILSVLNQYEMYENELSSIGITRLDSTHLRNALSKGAHVLHCPLKSIKFLKSIFPHGVVQAALMVGTKYNKNGLDALQEIKHIPNNLNMLIHYQDNDEIVSNKCDGEFLNELRNKNKHTFLSLGIEGGHHHSRNLPKNGLQETLHTFKKICHAPYNKKYAQLTLSQLVYEKEFKADDDIDAYIKNQFQSAKQPIIHEDQDLTIKPTWFMWGGIIGKKTKYFSKDRYLVNNKPIDCADCARKIAHLNNMNNQEVLKVLGRRLVNGKHICL